MAIPTQDFTAGVLRLHLGDRTGDGTGGPEIRVYGPTAEGRRESQLLRFDCFKVEPHYHYDPNGRDDKIDLEGVDAEDPIGWSLAQLRERLPEMIAQAGGSEEAVASGSTDQIRMAIRQIALALGRA